MCAAAARRRLIVTAAAAAVDGRSHGSSGQSAFCYCCSAGDRYEIACTAAAAMDRVDVLRRLHQWRLDTAAASNVVVPLWLQPLSGWPTDCCHLSDRQLWVIGNSLLLAQLDFILKFARLYTPYPVLTGKTRVGVSGIRVAPYKMQTWTVSRARSPRGRLLSPIAAPDEPDKPASSSLLSLPIVWQTLVWCQQRAILLCRTEPKLPTKLSCPDFDVIHTGRQTGNDFFSTKSQLLLGSPPLLTLTVTA